MKKLLALLALSAAVTAASATTLGFEYLDVPANSATAREQFGIAYLAEDTKYGTFDIGISGDTTADTTGTSKGLEVGYSRNYQLGKYEINPRVAVGGYNGLATDGYTQLQRYYLAKIEVRRAITEKVGAYTSLTHLQGFDDGGLASTNRFQLGADYSVTKAISLRAGALHQAVYNTTQTGFLVGASYSF